MFKKGSLVVLSSTIMSKPHQLEPLGFLDINKLQEDEHFRMSRLSNPVLHVRNLTWILLF